MILRHLLDRLRLWRMERRGEAVVDTEVFFDSFTTLADDLIPGRDFEIPRDLFGILAFCWAARADRGGSHHPFQVLRHISDRAWIAYHDMPKLIETIRAQFPPSDTRRRLLLHFDELHEKRGTYLFLPIVSRIERHQAGPLPVTLHLDAIMDAFGTVSSAALVRQAFALAPKAGRERNVFFLALLTRSWGRDHVFDAPNEFYSTVAAQLRLLYERPDEALSALRAEADIHPAVPLLLEIADEITSPLGRPLLLEALFITENWIAGPQHFAHSFEIEGRRIQDMTGY